MRQARARAKPRNVVRNGQRYSSWNVVEAITGEALEALATLRCDAPTPSAPALLTIRTMFSWGHPDSFQMRRKAVMASAKIVVRASSDANDNKIRSQLHVAFMLLRAADTLWQPLKFLGNSLQHHAT
jgi:hypothetical protein